MIDKNLDIESILPKSIPPQTYHIFYKGKQLKKLSAPTPAKIKQLIKENINPPKSNKKIYIIRIKINKDNPSRQIIVSCSKHTITTNLGLIVDPDDYAISVVYSTNSLEKYGFELAHIKKIIKALETCSVSLEKSFIDIGQILK